MMLPAANSSGSGIPLHRVVASPYSDWRHNKYQVAELSAFGIQQFQVRFEPSPSRRSPQRLADN
jgi:hypothetical protein